MPRPDAREKLTAAGPRTGPSKLLIGGAIVVVLLLVGGFAWLRTEPFAARDAGAPENGRKGGAGLLVYPEKAKGEVPTVDIYEDFQCPYCGQLEKTSGADLTKAAQAGKIKLRVHMLSFLDENVGNDSSKRAANAAFCSSDAGRFAQYHSALFAAQPAKEGQGYSDQTLRSAAKKAGITGDTATTFNKCVAKNTYGDYVKDTQKKANDDGINGTPRVLIDGKAVDDQQMQQLLSTPGSFDAILREAG